MPAHHKKPSQTQKESKSNENNVQFEKQFLPDGKKNPNYIDVLKVSRSRSGQEFVVLGFISPENILKQREMFLWEHFIQEWDFSKCMEKSVGFVNFMAYKYNLNPETLLKDFEEFVKEEGELLRESSMEDEYKNFLDKREEALNKEFNIKHNFQTSCRSVKFYGAFSTQQEAERYIKDEIDEDDIINAHTGPAGTWLYWDPDPHKTSKVEYQEEQVNRLYQEKMLNDKKKDEEFKRRVLAAKRKAIEDNIAKAKKSGAYLTQTIDDQGNLIGVKEMGKLNLEERDARADNDKVPIPASLSIGPTQEQDVQVEDVEEA